MPDPSSDYTPDHETPLFAARRPVVTAFLWDGERIALFLRSEHVSTYAEHWAGVSGYLEDDEVPFDRALREIQEECGLDRTHLTLCNEGDPLDIDDDVDGLSFRVFPFLFRVDDPTLVKQGAEAQALEWIDIGDLQIDLERLTVPGLYDAFDTVWPPWGATKALRTNIDLAVAWLASDREMGAGQMARAAASEIAKLVRLCGEEGFDSGRKEIDRALTAFNDARPAMAAPVNMMHDLREAFVKCDTPGAFLEAIDKLTKQSEQAEAAVAQQAAARIREGERLITISYSGTVLRMLVTAKPRVAHVYVCEGRPVLEGRRMARDIAREGIAVTLITDAQAFALMPRVDRAVIGADTILRNHDAVNKVGSAHLAFAARHYDKPFTVVAATHKFVRVNNTGAVPIEDNPPAEVWAGAPENIEVYNTYYEAVPHTLITQIITEHGPQSAG